MKAKLRVNRNESRQIEVELPYYCGGAGCHWYCWTGGSHCVQVSYADLCPDISGVKAGHLGLMDGEPECSREEFWKYFELAISHVRDLLPFSFYLQLDPESETDA